MEGLENLPSASNFIIVSNHVSWLDSLFFVAVIPGKIYGVSAWYLYRSAFLKWFLSSLDSIPTRGSARKVISLLEKNKVVGLFPEGGCSRDGRLKRFRKGAAFAALKTGRPVVPCAIFGTFESYPIGAKFPKIFRRIRIKIGKPLYFLKEFDPIVDDVLLQGSTQKIRKSIEGLLING